jgi:hypothetical protein
MKGYCSHLETGPKPKTAHRPARAQLAPRARPHRGPGPGKPLPTWATTWSDNREPSICIQRPRMESGRTKLRRRPCVNPRVHSVFLVPCRAAARPDGIAAGPLAGARPPMGGRATVERLLGRALPTHRSERATALVGRRVTRRRMAPRRALSPVRVPVDGWTRRRRAAPRQGHTRTAMAGPEPTATSGGSRSTHTASGSIHSQW